MPYVLHIAMDSVFYLIKMAASPASYKSFGAWVSDLQSLDTSSFLQTLQSWDCWEWSRLDDLEPAQSFLERIDPLLDLQSDPNTLKLLLERSLQVLKHTTSKGIYGSVERLTVLLDHEDCEVVSRVLDILQTLVTRATQNIKLTKAHKNPALCAKLYVIALGAQLNSGVSVSLADLCQGAMDLSLISLRENGETRNFHIDSVEVSEKYRYFLLNRHRMCRWSDTNPRRELMVTCQLQALSVLLQSTPEPSYLQDFCRTLPDLWFLPAVPELLKMTVKPELHAALLHVLTAILVMNEGQMLRNESSQMQVISSTYTLLALWQQHGLLQSLLRDLTNSTPTTVAKESIRYPEFVEAVLYLSSICADYKSRNDTAHIPGMTVSLLRMLERTGDNYDFTFTGLSKAVRILCLLVSQSIDMFKEAEGMQKVLQVASYEIENLAANRPIPYSPHINRRSSVFERAYYIRGLLRLIKVALSKWDVMPGLATSEVRKVVGSQLMDSLRAVYESRNTEIFEQSVQLLTSLINEQASVVPDLIARGTIPALLQALETITAVNPKLMAAVARVLCAVSLHAEGAKLLEGFNTVAKLLQGLGSLEGMSLTNDLAVDIAESLQDVLSRVSSFKDKAVEGSLAMLTAFYKAPHPSQEKFFTQLTNICRLLAVLFNFSADLFRIFIEKDGFESFLSILMLPILPQTFNNEFHGVLHLFKSFQGTSQSSPILTRVLDCIEDQLQLLERMIGPLSHTKDMRDVKDCALFPGMNSHDQLIVVLTRVDSLVDLARQLICLAGVLGDSAPQLSSTLHRLGELVRILICEQARLAPTPKPDKFAPEFNMPIDIKDIENPEVKSFDENFYFTCQLSIRKLFRGVTRLGQLRNRQAYTEDTAETLAAAMGTVLSRLVSELDLTNLEANQAYYYSLLLSDVVKVLVNDQAPNLVMLAFYRCEGLQKTMDFLVDLKHLSFSLQQQEKLQFDLVNCLQILWNLGGKLLESMFQNKFSSSRDPPGVYQKFGLKDQRELQRLMQSIALSTLQRLENLKCGSVSLAFARSVIEIFRLGIDFMRIETENSMALKLQDMGFSEKSVKDALQQLGSRASLNSVTELILRKGDVQTQEEDENTEIAEKLVGLHVLIAGSIGFAPALATSLAELLYKIAQKAGQLIPEILDALIGQVNFSFRNGKDCEVLSAVLQSISMLATRCQEAVTHLIQTSFPRELLLPISEFQRLPGDLKATNGWLTSAFSILEVLVRCASFSKEEVMQAVIAYLSEEISLSEDGLNSLLQLLLAVTEPLEYSKAFVSSGCLPHLLSVRSEARSNKTQYLPLLLQLSESPLLFKMTIEQALTQWLGEGKQSLKVLLEKFSPQIRRSKTLFKTVFESLCKITKSAKGEAEVEERKEKEEVVTEDWEVVSLLAQALREQHSREQTGETDRFLLSDQLVGLLSEVLQNFPIAVQHLVKSDFMAFLVQELIPFKYHLKLDSGKVLFTYPGNQTSVTPQSYQAWVKATLKLLKVLTFKHAQTQLNEGHGKANHSILKARKQLMKALNRSLQDSIKPGWFQDPRAVSIVRSCAIVIMQLLRETPKAPFTSNNPAELAKGLLSDKFTMVKHLSTAATGVDLHFRRAASVLNLLFAPLEILTRYAISFLLHSSKQQPCDVEPVEEEVEVLDIEKYDFSGSESSHPISASVSGDEVEEEGEEMSVDDPSSSMTESQQDEENEDSSAGEVEEEITEEEDEGTDLVVVETRNTEPFWADVDQDEGELAEFGREPWGRNLRPAWEPSLAQERQLVDPPLAGDFDPEMHQPPIIVNHRSIDRRQLMEIEQVPMFRGDVETGGDDFIHVLFSRSRRDQPAKNPPKPSDDSIESLLDELTEGVEVMPQVETEAPPAVPEIDPAFLEALPEDVRREVQHTLAPESDSRQGHEMDNASFVASLTPDLRREVLTNCPEDFLNSLPPELVAEARVYQERPAHRIVPHVVVEPQRRPENEVSEIAELDDKLAAALPKLDEDFIRLLLKAVYLLTPVNREILASMLLNLTANAENRRELLDVFVRLLGPETGFDFLPAHLFGNDTYLETPQQVFAIVTGRVLDLLQFLTKHNPKVSSQLFSSSHFLTLVNLLHLPLFKASPGHLNPLLLLLEEAVDKIKGSIPVLPDETLTLLCESVTYESISDNGMRVAQDLISLLCDQSENKPKIQEILTTRITSAANTVVLELRNSSECSGSLEFQLLKLCKILQVVNTECDFGMLNPLWAPLSAALNSLTQGESDLASTANPLLSKLLPVIETFFIAHEKHTTDDVFRLFCAKNRKVLNLVVRQNPVLLEDTLNSLISRFHNLLDFENKRSYFKTELRSQRPDRSFETIRLHVRRTDVFEDSFHQLKNRTAQELLGKLRVQFMGEEGIDAGGVAREWYSLLAKEMFNPNYALFVPAASNGVSFQPNPLSAINAEHLQYFKFVGRVIGKSLFDGVTLDVYFTRSFYKHILGQEITPQDMEDTDPDFYRSLTSINLDESDLQEYYFVATEERFGEVSQVELVPGGKDLRVTEANKMEYIKLLCDLKMTASIQSQLTAFLEGFHEIIPQKLVSIFDAKELELLVAGLPEVDLFDLKNNTEYHNYTQDSQVILWFWEVMQDFEQDERAEFIQFVTGSSKVPLEGFKALQGIGGVQKFQIHKSFTSPDRLPTAHTCMNQLDLPEYPTKEILRTRLKLAISEGKEGFGFA